MEIVKKDDFEIVSYADNDDYSAGTSTVINMGLNTTDELYTVKNNREKFFDNVAEDFRSVYLKQTHSAIIHRVGADFESGTEGDGLITTERGILLTVTTADCGVVIFVDRDAKLAAIAHCGWRGTKDEIIESICKKIKETTPLNNITAFIGPMIQSENYEVGEEFADYFSSSYLFPKDGKYYFDLNRRIYDILKEEGIGTIFNTKLDTFSDDRFFSYRRNSDTGRMVSFVGLK